MHVQIAFGFDYFQSFWLSWVALKLFVCAKLFGVLICVQFAFVFQVCIVVVLGVSIRAMGTSIAVLFHSAMHFLREPHHVLF